MKNRNRLALMAVTASMTLTPVLGFAVPVLAVSSGTDLDEPVAPMTLSANGFMEILNDALDNNGGIYVMDRDIILEHMPSDNENYFQIPRGVTVDLKGYTITIASDQRLFISNNSALVSSGSKRGTIKYQPEEASRGAVALFVEPQASAYLYNIDIEGEGPKTTGIEIMMDATLSMDQVKILCSQYGIMTSAVSNTGQGPFTIDGITLNMNNCRVVGHDAGIYNTSNTGGHVYNIRNSTVAGNCGIHLTSSNNADPHTLNIETDETFDPNFDYYPAIQGLTAIEAQNTDITIKGSGPVLPFILAENTIEGDQEYNANSPFFRSMAYAIVLDSTAKPGDTSQPVKGSIRVQAGRIEGHVAMINPKADGSADPVNRNTAEAQINLAVGVEIPQRFIHENFLKPFNKYIDEDNIVRLNQAEDQKPETQKPSSGTNTSGHVTATAGLKTENGYKVFYKNGQLVKNEFAKQSDQTYYFDADGHAVSGWQTIGENVYYFDPATNVMQTGLQEIEGKVYGFTGAGTRMSGWHIIGGNQYYFDPASGAAATGTITIDGTKYTFNDKGVLQPVDTPAQGGWIQENGNWQYVNEDGSVKTGLQTLKWNGKENTYLFDQNGKMEKGWKTIDGPAGHGWYYFDQSGAMKTSWLKNGGWFYLGQDGKMQTGWVTDKGHKYFLQSDGSLKTGWLKQNGVWYYLDHSGAMKTGWLKDNDGNWYYFSSDGIMLADTTVNGYHLDASGICLNP